MNREKRRTVIAGNWKMNKTPREAFALVSEIAAAARGKDKCDVVLCVPFVDIPAAVAAAEGTNVAIGAQNVHIKESGAYTGEVSAPMLVECGVKYVIVGHSERRQYFGETDETVRLRAKAAIDAGLTAIICVGEVIGQRQSGITNEIVSMQTKLALEGLTKDELSRVIIAYEPVWAIGTGLTATPEQAEEVCALIRRVVADLYDKEAADALTIQYGGSMNEKNAAELLAMENVDGGLIGGASLKATSFAAIINAANA